MNNNDEKTDIEGIKETNLPWNKYKECVEQILERARELTKAEVGVLFLSSDGIFLEAAEWISNSLVRPPASELPTYWLDWWNTDDSELDGITAFVALRKKIVNLSQKEVFNHSAHKGRWDAVFLEGERLRCKGILAAPLQREIGAELKKARMHGVLKVENPGDPDALGQFKSTHYDAFVAFSKSIATELDHAAIFWQQFVQSRAELKVSHIVELLEKGRSLQYNLSLGLGYVLKLFSMWLGCHDAVHVFWQENDKTGCHILQQWDLSTGESGEENRYHRKIEDKVELNLLLTWLKNNVGPKVVQPALSSDDKLWKLLFPGPSTIEDENKVDVIRLKGGNYDLGAIILPHSSLLSDNSLEHKVALGYASIEEKSEKDNLETLTKLALNVVSILGRFFEDEYEITTQTYLPEHRVSAVRKRCSILFADIRNFSQLTQILRLMNKDDDLERFLDCYCSRMGKLINDSKLGRLDKFMGDGLMAIFGEQIGSSDDDNLEKVLDAVVCAKRMVEQFDELYEEWFNLGLEPPKEPYGVWRSIEKDSSKKRTKPLRELIGRQFNENVKVGLGIGINIGDVFFDYFGYGSHREYTAVGDHVNFASRLQSAAGEFDDNQVHMHANILLSQTAYQYLQDYQYFLGENEPIWLRFKGFGFKYPVYELDPHKLNFDKIGNKHR
ncbi:MAG: adenylate/guanylate cyclase domain-containing protein [Ignavibacteria bacterium]|nr:adenylate/guanylate cyclase domain-containing protein [Ignavibacteria bacterium]